MDSLRHKIVEYVILASGEFPTGRKALECLKNADILICCDGAVDNVLSIRIPDFIVGDMDSISKENALRFARIMHREAEQEDNDLTKAFNLLMKLAGEKDERFAVTILGATGKREDHTLGNISLLMDYAAEAPSIRMVSDYGTFLPVFDTATFSVGTGAPVSIFSEDASLQILSRGLQYPTDHVIFNAWWKATLNFASADEITLIFNHPSKALLYIGEKK